MTQTILPDNDLEGGRARPPAIRPAREREDRTLGGLSALLDARPDLHGVHAPADWAYDALHWSV